MPINQPSNQIRLTNVSLVRLRKGKKRFEVACYKNKVLEWRSGAESDLDNVLQIHSVFLSVSKGQTAPLEDLRKSFGTTTQLDDIIKEILIKGEMQVGEKERHAQSDRLHQEVISIVAEKLVDPRTKRVYTTGMIDKALDLLCSQGTQHRPAESSSKHGQPDSRPSEAVDEKEGNKDKPTWSGVVTTKSAKSQALDAIKALIAWQPIPLARAKMSIRLRCPSNLLKQTLKDTHHIREGSPTPDEGQSAGTLKERVLSMIYEISNQDINGSLWEVTGFIEPGAFKTLNDLLSDATKGQGSIEILDMAVRHYDD